MTTALSPEHEAIAYEYRNRYKKLYKAADFIASVPDAQFNMNHWWLPNGQAFDDDRNVMYTVADGPCGCAVGHMVQRSLFGLDAEMLTLSRERIFVILGDTFGVGWMRAQFMFDQYAYEDSHRKNKHKVAARMRFIADEIGGVK